MPSVQSDYVSVVARLGGRNLPPGGEPAMTAILEAIPAGCRSIVDIGCNTGWVTTQLARAHPHASVTGVDLDSRMCAVAAHRAKRLEPAAGKIRFACLDVTALPRTFRELDAVVCAGSTAFFPDAMGAYDAVRRSLAAEGVFVDVNYVYEPAVPEDLRAAERHAFGIGSAPLSAARALLPFEQVGLSIKAVRRLPRYTLPDSDRAGVYRSLIAQVPGMQPLADEMLRRRTLIGRLAAYRHPLLVAADRGPSPAAARRDPGALARAAQIMEAFSTPFPPLPLSHLQRLPPYGFLAYVGDPDAAPGGAASVKRAAALLRTLGVPADGAVLDVGSFTGMSTFVLGTEFSVVRGIDIEPEFVRAANCLSRGLASRARFEAGDAGRTRFPEGSFDAVVMTATLGYAERPGELIREAYRLLRPGGVFVEFLYHYPSRTPAVREAVRSAVSAHVAISSLTRQVARIEHAGFRLERAERLARESPDPAWIDALASAAAARERLRQPLSDDDARTFLDMFRRYVGRVRIPGAEPSVYLCAFRRPSPDW